MAFPLGHLADKLGMKFATIIGIVFFCIAYFIFPFANTALMYFIAFFVYAFFAAASEGISKAWISKNCSVNEKATALGFYSGMQSIVILFANVLAGLLWSKFSPETLFYTSTFGAVIVLLYFLVFIHPEVNRSSISHSAL